MLPPVGIDRLLAISLGISAMVPASHATHLLIARHDELSSIAAPVDINPIPAPEFALPTLPVTSRGGADPGGYEPGATPAEQRGGNGEFLGIVWEHHGPADGQKDLGNHLTHVSNVPADELAALKPVQPDSQPNQPEHRPAPQPEGHVDGHGASSKPTSPGEEGNGEKKAAGCSRRVSGQNKDQANMALLFLAAAIAFI